MGAINFYVQEHFLHSLTSCFYSTALTSLFPWVQCQSLKPVLSQCSQTGFVTVDVFIALYTRSYVFYSYGCNKFLHAKTFFTLTDTTSVQMLICLLFRWMQCQSLKPVLSQCCQTGFVTVDYFIVLYTLSYVFYSQGCNKFLHARIFFTFTDTIAPIFTMLTEVWPCANRAMVTNN